MSILHTLAPVRVGSVGLKPTKEFPLKKRNWFGDAVSWESVQLHLTRPDNTRGYWRRVTCLVEDPSRGSSRHRKSLGHQHGLGPFDI
ncbi:hypothetical protein EVAR_93327_1 [Eumeta japonica]|uniref:Uncharacterized protein n=1 Tax=Eumeta variegata TaxID=151549 RepID=A0A4C1UTI0_EUMVA|nr:hypothetical protein EVAR_93327_1 [Eumeta japonica]